MRIQHNIAALNSHRNMGVNNASTNKNLEKLSSGYRINRAGDDAAGLAISEKMRGQIRGLSMAEQNTSNAISLIQTAEGGLNETHAILQRMRELAVQSSNGTYDEDVDRANLDLEFQAIKDEIDRISTSTHYNGIKLLDGSLGANDSAPAVNGVAYDGAQKAMTPVAGTNFAQAAPSKAAVVMAAAGADSFTVEVAYRDLEGNMQSQSFSVAGNTSYANQVTDLDKQLNDFFEDSGVSFAGSTIDATGVTLGAVSGKEAGETKFELAQVKVTNDTSGVVSTGGAAGAVTNGTNAGNNVTLTGSKFLEVDGKKFQFVSDPSQVEQGATGIFVGAGKLDANGALQNLDADTQSSILAQLKDNGYNVKAGTVANTDIRFEAGEGEGLTFQIGANGGEDQRVSLNVGAMDSKSLGETDATGKLTSSLASADIRTIEGANKAIDIITGATNMVSTQRAGLGALQNRLEHTMNNLGVTKENLTSAESVIRDVDMAKEMMDFTKNQILVQSSQAMLAQANQLPQGVLSLLR